MCVLRIYYVWVCVYISESKHCTSITGRKRIFSESFLLQLAHKQREQTTTLHWGNFYLIGALAVRVWFNKKTIRKIYWNLLLLLLLFQQTFEIFV